MCACDCYVEGIEAGEAFPHGFELQGILNIDHHAPVKEMMKPISSGNLACAYVRSTGSFGQETAPSGRRQLSAEVPLIINHTDCDSVISSLIMRGHIPDEEMFEKAVLAADHYGNADQIADLLQALDEKKDLRFSVESLIALLRDEPLRPEAQHLMVVRTNERERAATVYREKLFEVHGPLIVVRTDLRISGEFLPPLFPDAALIVAISSHAYSTSSEPVWEVKLRRGWAAPEQVTLFDLNMKRLDPGFGGRWNAGSNTRAGGTRVAPDEYVSFVRQQLESAIARVS